MSTVKDEADDGPLDVHGEEGGAGEEALVEDESDQAQEDSFPTLNSGQSNGIEEEDDSIAASFEGFRGNGRQAQDSGSEDSVHIQATRPDLGRPSSADGSVSIPDDTPSVQVSSRLRDMIPVPDCTRAP
jgi:hypothetical protein